MSTAIRASAPPTTSPAPAHTRGVTRSRWRPTSSGERNSTTGTESEAERQHHGDVGAVDRDPAPPRGERDQHARDHLERQRVERDRRRPRRRRGARAGSRRTRRPRPAGRSPRRAAASPAPPARARVSTGLTPHISAHARPGSASAPRASAPPPATRYAPATIGTIAAKRERARDLPDRERRDRQREHRRHRQQRRRARRADPALADVQERPAEQEVHDPGGRERGQRPAVGVAARGSTSSVTTRQQRPAPRRRSRCSGTSRRTGPRCRAPRAG